VGKSYDNANAISAAVESGPGPVIWPAWWLTHSVSVTGTASDSVNVVRALHTAQELQVPN